MFVQQKRLFNAMKEEFKTVRFCIRLADFLMGTNQPGQGGRSIFAVGIPLGNSAFRTPIVSPQGD
jgi:hypothetical protein